MVYEIKLGTNIHNNIYVPILNRCERYVLTLVFLDNIVLSARSLLLFIMVSFHMGRFCGKKIFVFFSQKRDLILITK